jgi:two-component system, OmpR family, alkaline phosphatase synthesis response regulator PhoP
MGSKLLIVDDEAHIRRLLERTLMDFEDDGVELILADNGEDALQIIRDERPNLVFLDVMMPRMNGFDVCHAVKHELGLDKVYIVMLTAKGQEFDRARSIQVGADVYLTKPFDPDEVYDLTKRILAL